MYFNMSSINIIYLIIYIILLLTYDLKIIQNLQPLIYWLHILYVKYLN